LSPTSRSRTSTEIRDDFAWLRSGSSPIVTRADGVTEWWTFAGGRANAALAAAIEKAAGRGPARFDNFAVRPLAGADVVARIVADLRSRGPGEIRPAVSEESVSGLKFSDCLPPSVAKCVLAARLADPRAMEALAERSAASDGVPPPPAASSSHGSQGG
jgi:ATP-dependent Lhr-like helicase